MVSSSETLRGHKALCRGDNHFRGPVHGDRSGVHGRSRYESPRGGAPSTKIAFAPFVPLFDSRELAALAEVGPRELCSWRPTIDMKVMHAWHQQIEPVAHTARDSTAAAMARVTCPMTRTTSTVGRHAVRGVGSASKAHRLVLLRNRCSPITALFDDREHGCRYACMSPILPGKSAPGGTLHFFEETTMAT